MDLYDNFLDPVEFVDWGHIDYEKAWTQQKNLVEERRNNKIPDLFIFCEHDPVITMGKGREKEGQLPFLPPQGIPVVDIERGGLATYHGPGQLVCYPITRLAPKKESRFGGVVNFIRFLEEAMINMLQEEYKLNAQRSDGNTGVWIEGKRKIASIGIAVSHWISYHGLALNVSTDKNAWRAINPCGFEASVMTSLNEECGKEFSLAEVKNKLSKHISLLLK